MNYTEEILKILVKKQFREMESIREAYKEPIVKIKYLMRELIKECVNETQHGGHMGYCCGSQLSREILSKADTLIGEH